MEALRDSRLGRYEILEEIGRGSAGVVYLARDTRTGGEVALKTLNDGVPLDDRDLQRVRALLLNEANAGTLLAHPGITAVHDLVDEPGAGEIYLAMEYVDGVSLAEILSRPDPLPFDFVVDVIAQVADVLDHIHAHGVVHRDVKPANILVTGDGRVKVTDFGIAELKRDGLAEELRRMGSPHYLSPERVLGAEADYRSDIYALGVVLYEMLTRNRPFQGASQAELVRSIAADDPAPAAQFTPNLLPGLQEILDRVLSKEPEDRYQYAGEMTEELKAIQARQATLSSTVPAAPIPIEDGRELSAGTGGSWIGRLRLAEWARAARRALAGAAGHLRPGRRFWPALGAAAAVAALAILLGSAPGEEKTAGPLSGADAAQRDRLEYLALLEEAKRLLEAGETRAAAGLFERAEALSPDAARIRALRDEARREAQREVAAELALEVSGLLGIARSDLEEGRLTEAADAAGRILELAPEHAEALAILEEVERIRRVRRLRARPVVEEPPPPPAPAPEPEPEPEPLRIEQPIEVEPRAPVATFADLKVDFYSRQSRGVVTLYCGDKQVLLREFRFAEKKGFLRKKGLSGGFDEQLRLGAGPAEFRVYLSLPGRETQIERLPGRLPAGTIRTLKVRVDESGALDVELH